MQFKAGEIEDLPNAVDCQFDNHIIYTYILEERTLNAANARAHQRLPSGKNDGKGHNGLH